MFTGIRSRDIRKWETAESAATGNGGYLSAEGMHRSTVESRDVSFVEKLGKTGDNGSRITAEYCDSVWAKGQITDGK